jgi:hypothetical protein
MTGTGFSKGGEVFNLAPKSGTKGKPFSLLPSHEVEILAYT